MIPGLSLMKLLIGGVVVVGLGIGAYQLFSSDLPDATPLADLPDLIHDRIAKEIASELPEVGAAALILPPITGDRNEAIRTRLARAIDRSGRFDVKIAERPQPENWFESEVLPKLEEWLEDLPGISSDDDAPGWLLDARVGSRQDDEDALALEVEWQLRNLREEGRPEAAGEAEERIERSVLDGDYLRWQIGETPIWARGIAWLAVLWLPWIALRGLFAEVLRKESNGWNAALWFAVAVPGVVSGYVLSAFAAGFWGVIVAALAALATVVLSYAWLDAIESTRR